MATATANEVKFRKFVAKMEVNDAKKHKSIRATFGSKCQEAAVSKLKTGTEIHIDSRTHIAA
jgi:hypothetical protein